MAEELNAAATLSDSMQYDVDIARASLNHDEQVQFDAAVAAHAADGTLDDNAIFHAQQDALQSQASLDHARETQHEQAEAAERGDLRAARELSHDAEYDLRVAEDHGADAAHPTLDAQQDHQYADTQALDHGAREQDTAAVYQADADAHAASGDLAHAAYAEDAAIAHADTAAYDAGAGDHGGSYATASTTADAGAEAATA